MKKSYSHFAALAFAALTFSSCSRANYATNPTSTPLAAASIGVAQAPAGSPAAELSAQVVAPKLPAEAAAAATPQPAVAVAPAPASPQVAASPTAPAAVVVAPANQPSIKAAKPSLGQRLMLQKVTKQLAKADARHQNTAGVAHTAASSGSLTILLVGLVLLLVGILISASWLITVGSIVAVIGLILLLLKAL